MRSIYLSLLALAVVDSVSAALYPTRPTSATIFTAGQFETVTWKDDKFKPHLYDLGPVRIDLYTEKNTYVTTLARNVNPMNLERTLFIPQDILSSGSAFALLFKSLNPPVQVYTATFTITDRSQNTIDHWASNDTTADTTEASPVALTLVLPNTTTLSTTQPTATQEDAASTTVFAGPLPHSQAHSGTGKSDRSARGGSERLILWLFLVGILVAL